MSQIQLVVIDSLSAPLSSYLVPSLSIKLVKEQDEKQDKSKNWRTSERTKKRRRSYFGNDNDVVARKIIQNTLNGLVRETLLEIVNSRLLSVSQEVKCYRRRRGTGTRLTVRGILRPSLQLRARQSLQTSTARMLVSEMQNTLSPCLLSVSQEWRPL